MVRPVPFAIALLALATSAQAQTRVDLFDKKSNRTGSAMIDERSSRLDSYDTQSAAAARRAGGARRGGRLALLVGRRARRLRTHSTMGTCTRPVGAAAEAGGDASR